MIPCESDVVDDSQYVLQAWNKDTHQCTQFYITRLQVTCTSKDMENHQVLCRCNNQGQQTKINILQYLQSLASSLTKDYVKKIQVDYEEETCEEKNERHAHYFLKLY